MKKGCFITVEGVEGVGKSTNVAVIESVLRDHDIEFVTTREPGGTVLSEKIRELLLDKTEKTMTVMTELLLVFAARSQHVETLIMPALAQGKWVICDRFTDSSFAYQGAGRESNLEKLIQLEKFVLAGFTPDLTFLLDLPVEIGLERAGNRGALDRFESEDLTFFTRVRQGFLDRAESDARFRIVDAVQPLPLVKQTIERETTAWVEQWQLQ